MKINRLIEITTILLNKDKVTAKELAQRFEVSPRTIYRDIEDLSQAGVPVYMTKGTRGGISILEGYSLNKTLLSNSDKENMMLGLKTLQATSLPEIESAIKKISSLFSDIENDWVQIDFSGWGSNPNENNKFNNIKQALIRRQIIKFKYINSSGEGSERIVEPSRLIYKAKAWYLLGYCRIKSNFRLFRISRIQDIQMSTDRFIRKSIPQELNASIESTEVGELVQLKLRFQPRCIYRVYDDFDHKDIIKNNDGTCDVNTAFPEDDWVYGYILSYGKDVEVIEPSHVRETIIQRLEESIKLYKNDF